MEYYVPDHSESRKDARLVPDSIKNPKHDRFTAEAIAEHKHPGSWWECTWPITIVLVDDETETTWEIHRDMVPEFWAKQVKIRR